MINEVRFAEIKLIIYDVTHVVRMQIRDSTCESVRECVCNCCITFFLCVCGCLKRFDFSA